MTTTLVRGANAPLRSASQQPTAEVRVELAWRSARVPAVLTAVACDDRGRALSPAHQVTWQRPTSAGGRDRFEVLVDLRATPDDVVSVVLALDVPGPGVRALAGLTATVRTASGEPLAAYPVEDLPDAPGLLVTEVYRRSGQWKVRAIGQGLVQGRSGLLRSVGLPG
ncbi:TerD family protein [Geodermatophilus sp. SYSU D00684]